MAGLPLVWGILMRAYIDRTTAEIARMDSVERSAIDFIQVVPHGA